MQDNTMLSLRERLRELPTGELDEMLHAELRKESPDEYSVRLILSILEEREKPAEMDAQTEAAWEKYRERMNMKPARRRSRSWIRLTTTLAATAVLALLVLVPQRADALEFIRDVISGWRNDILEFFSPGETVSELKQGFETDHPAMQLIYDTAVEMGIEEPLIPTWFEEGYEVAKYEYISTPSKNRLNFVLSSDNREVVFNIDIFSTEAGRGYYGNDDFHQSYERDGILFEITRNYEKNVAIWRKDNIEYFIIMDCQEDILDKILASIYVMED